MTGVAEKFAVGSAGSQAGNGRADRLGRYSFLEHFITNRHGHNALAGNLPYITKSAEVQIRTYVEVKDKSVG